MLFIGVYIPCPCPLRVSLPVCPAAFGVFLFSFVFQLYLCLNFLFVLIIIYLSFVAFWGKFFVICLCLHYITIKSLSFINYIYICSLLCPDLPRFVLPLAVSSVRVYGLYMPRGFLYGLYMPPFFSPCGSFLMPCGLFYAPGVLLYMGYYETILPFGLSCCPLCALICRII